MRADKRKWTRVEVGVKASSKKKLVMSTWAGDVEKWEMKNWQREQMPRHWRGNGGEDDRNCDALTVIWKLWYMNEKTDR